ncbi:DNA replication complex GINS protein PSF1 [Geodia barretti]|uniref:DNA replication complex GINS protein PSF1 n=1 Tax=Geodia barretti TaxID=519541 RepID=A0AA35TA24_GEOBA|nr:DNA replication complex GINS protein PSF1 [Geodia barretti]
MTRTVNILDLGARCLGEKALELVRELKRSQDGNLPPYNEDGIRQVVEEMRALFEQNQLEVRATTDGERGLLSGIQLRHACLERNQRCLLAYVHHRMTRIRDYRWQTGSVLPPSFRLSLCEQEIQWFTHYNRSLATYMRSIAPTGLDLTQHLQPPKSLLVEVRCLEDYGEFEMEDGTVVLLHKNTQHYLPRSQCEPLIRQGVLEHIH